MDNKTLMLVYFIDIEVLRTIFQHQIRIIN